MAIVDQWGNRVHHRFARSAERWDGSRPYEPIQVASINELLPAYDRYTLYSHARRIYGNFGPIIGAINQRAMYSVGRAWKPSFTGTDKEFGKTAHEYLVDIFYKIGDVRGGMHDLVTNLYVWSVMLDRDGEVFVLLTETENGFPKYQTIEAHNIQTPEGVKEDDRVDGGVIREGVVYWPSGEPKSFALVDPDCRLIEYIDAANVIHLFDPSWCDQGRGITQLAHCLNDCRDALQSHSWERFHMLLMSSENYIEHNELGAADMDDNAMQLIGMQGNPGVGVSYETRADGLVRYARAGTGYKVEQIKNDRPGGAWGDFQDRIIRSAFFGLGWPYSFWKGSGAGGGTTQRTEIATAQRSVEDRQDLLQYAAHRLIGYAISKAAKRGDLPRSPEWMKWKFTMPAKLTIDDGRLMRELTALWKIGATNMREIVGMKGGELEQHLDERAEEVALRKLAAKRASEKYGVEVTPMEMAETPDEPNEPNDENETTPDRQPRRQGQAE